MILKLLSKFFGLLAGLPLPSIALVPIIKLYAFIFKINTEEAELELSDFKSLDSFFVRRLKNKARPISSSTIISPADGKIVEVGTFRESHEINVKGLQYSLKTLFAGHDTYQLFTEGSYSVIYLSPSDYHCVHSSVKGRIAQTIFISGHLRTVNPSFSSALGKTLVENERTITLIETENFGVVSIIMVGATNVGSIELEYLNPLEQPKVSLSAKQGIARNIVTDKPYTIEKGGLLGRFHLGSTVIVCFQNNSLEEKMLRGFSSDSEAQFEKILFGQNLLAR